VVTKGHPFDAPAFFAVFDSMAGIRWTHVEHPDALRLVEPGHAAEFDVFVMYDMPGITFTRGDPPAVFAPPPPGYAAAFRQLLDDGKGMVFLHHAIAGWPAWDEYAEIIGGRFHYQPAVLDGVAYPDSGYRHDVHHVVEVLDPTHPICEGLDASFSLTDELYLFPVLETRVRPLLRSTYDFVDTNFYSADRAIRGSRDDNSGWHHPPGSSLVAWTRTVGASPIAYVQFGDGPATYQDANYRRILSNAIRWAADAAHAEESGSVVIRQETLDDHDAIRRVVAAAFQSAAEAALVDRIRASPEYVPEMALVAEVDGEVVGQVMISGAIVRNPDGDRPIVMLSPLAVLPAFQRTGIGSSLVRSAVRVAEQRGEPLVVLEGSPAYYGKLGFEHSRTYGIEIHLPEWAPPEAAQVIRLASFDPDDPTLRGTVVYPTAFDAL